MQSSVDDVFLVVDRGSVIFQATSLSAAKAQLSIFGRGVLCKVLCAELGEFIQQNTDTKKPTRKVRLRDTGG